MENWFYHQSKNILIFSSTLFKKTINKSCIEVNILRAVKSEFKLLFSSNEHTYLRVAFERLNKLQNIIPTNFRISRVKLQDIIIIVSDRFQIGLQKFFWNSIRWRSKYSIFPNHFKKSKNIISVPYLTKNIDLFLETIFALRGKKNK